MVLGGGCHLQCRHEERRVGSDISEVSWKGTSARPPERVLEPSLCLLGGARVSRLCVSAAVSHRSGTWWESAIRTMAKVLMQ